jgi:hypothetical protein
MTHFIVIFWIFFCVPYLIAGGYLVSLIPDLVEDVLSKTKTVWEFLTAPSFGIGFMPLVNMWMMVTLPSIISFIISLVFVGHHILPTLSILGILNFGILFSILPIGALVCFFADKIRETSKIIDKYFPEAKLVHEPKLIELDEIELLFNDDKLMKYKVGDIICYRRNMKTIGLDNRFFDHINQIFLNKQTNIHYFTLSDADPVRQIQITGEQAYKIRSYKEKEKWDDYLRHP